LTDFHNCLNNIHIMYYYNTAENSGADKILQNYSKIDETGKEKLKEVAEKIMDIWEITHDPKKENQYGIKSYS